MKKKAKFSMKNILSILIVFMPVVFFTACSPNTRIFYIDSIACSASNRDTEEWSYYLIELGTPSKPYSGEPVIDINIPGISEFRSNAISVEEIKKMPGAKVSGIGPVGSTPNVGYWSQSAKEIFCGPYLSFVINDNKVLQITIMHRGNFRLGGTQKWYKFPCSEKDLIEVFGKPEKTYEWPRD